jgi:hypothetical protein
MSVVNFILMASSSAKAVEAINYNLSPFDVSNIANWNVKVLSNFYTKGAEDICVTHDFETSRIIYMADVKIGVQKISLADFSKPKTISTIEL